MSKIWIFFFYLAKEKRVNCLLVFGMCCGIIQLGESL
jgi:hypothetical protein